MSKYDDDLIDEDYEDNEHEVEEDEADDKLDPETQQKIENFVTKIRSFEKAESQMLVLIAEFAELSKKKPDGAINKFKLKYLNQILGVLNESLQEKRPFEDFTLFDEDAIPSNSDVKMMLSQYASQTLAFRKENSRPDSGRTYYWILDGEPVLKTVEPFRRSVNSQS